MTHPSWGQFQTLSPQLLQPRDSQTVIVFTETVAGINFDWTDVPEATHYLYEIHKLVGGVPTDLVTSITTTQSHFLFQANPSPLEVGTEFTWKVTAFMGTTPGQPSTASEFDVAEGTASNPARPPGDPTGPPAPDGLVPVEGNEFTFPVLANEGLFLRWNDVPAADGYEVQVLFESSSEGTPAVNALIVRMDVVGPHTLISNLTQLGIYRYEVRSIADDPAKQRVIRRSEDISTERFKVVQRLSSDIAPATADGLVNSLDLLTLSRNWHLDRADAPDPQADIVFQDFFIEQADLLALLIQNKQAPLAFPQPRPIPTSVNPIPLATPTLLAPADGAIVTLNTPGESIQFTWEAVPNADRYTLDIRNNFSAQSALFNVLPMGATQITLPGSTFNDNLNGGGGYDWKILADGPSGFLQSQSAQRSFSLILNFTKSGKAVEMDDSIWKKAIELVLGQAAEAGPESGDPQIGQKGIPAPEILFPVEDECFVTSVATNPLVWSEVPGANAYAVEIELHVFGSVFFLSLLNTSRESGQNYSLAFDDQEGNSTVDANFISSAPSDDYRVRVAARIGNSIGPFSQIRRFSRLAVCEEEPQPEYVDIDFSENGSFDPLDFFLFTRSYRSFRENILYTGQADLAPEFPDGVVNQHDVINFFGLYSIKDQLPTSPPLPAPAVRLPPEGFIFDKTSPEIIYEWDPNGPAQSSLPKPVAWEIEILQPNGAIRSTFTGTNNFREPRGPEGPYFWRVRSISSDGTRGAFSRVRAYLIVAESQGPLVPEVFGPEDGAILPVGPVEFVWSRNSRSSLLAVFDRLEIRNGGGPIYHLDIYHRFSERDLPTVTNQVPLKMNYGPDFFWRVRTVYLNDNILGELLPLIGDASEWRSFTLEGDTASVGGIGSWSADTNGDGQFSHEDVFNLHSAYETVRADEPAYNHHVDMNRDGQIEVSDVIRFLESYNGLRPLSAEGPPPVVIGHVVEAAGQLPPVIPARADFPPTARQGVPAEWFDSPGITQYIVEWVNAINETFGLYATRLDPPNLISPINNELVSLPGANDPLTLTWDTVPDASNYGLVLENVSSSAPLAGFIVDEFTPGLPTVSFSIPRSDLLNLLNGPGNYEWRVQPRAEGTFANTSTIECFSVSFSKDGSDYFEMAHPIAKNSRPGFFLPGGARVPALGEHGLHAWRVLGLSDDFVITPPTSWQRFGVEHRGAAFGEGPPDEE